MQMFMTKHRRIVGIFQMINIGTDNRVRKLIIHNSPYKHFITLQNMIMCVRLYGAYAYM